jgi:uncharacterized membrane protein YbhN (UPF0104 family)
MRTRKLHLLSWFAGLSALLIVVWHFQLSTFFSEIRRVGIEGCLAWLVLTFCGRLLLVEIAVLPIGALGYSLRRFDAFWIGWIRTFANQIVPFLGLAVYTRQIQRRCDMPWSGIVALSTPMFFLATAAMSTIGLFAVAMNVAHVGASTVPMLVAFALVGSGSVFAATHAGWMIGKLPNTPFSFTEQSAAAFRRISEGSLLVLRLIALHAFAILVLGTRIWLLFVLVGAEVSLSAALLIIVIAESAALFHITPGGLGLREGTIIGAAILLEISPELGAVVALIDRLFSVATTTFMAIPAFVILRR